MSENIRERVLTMLKENIEDDYEWDKIEDDDDLAMLGVNSVTFIKLVVATEMEFDIEWDDENLNVVNFSTINNIVDYISSCESND